MIKPLKDNVIVTMDSNEKTTASGLIVLDTADQLIKHGTVIAVGTGRIHEKTGERIEPEVVVGDVVYFGAGAPQETEVDDEKVFFIKETDIVARARD